MYSDGIDSTTNTNFPCRKGRSETAEEPEQRNRTIMASTPSTDHLTKRQLDVFYFIRDKIQSRGYGPTVREIGDAFDISSPNGVVCHLKALEKKGLISREKNMSRAIQLKMEVEDRVGLPLAGRIAAGVLHEAISQDERVDFGSMFSQHDHFVLEVTGDSMTEAHIDDGDYVVVKQQSSAPSGSIVVAETDDGEATLKYWFPEKNRIRLQPANGTMKPIYVKNAKVRGVVIGVVRKF